MRVISPQFTSIYTLLDSYLIYIERVEGRATSTVKNRYYILRDFTRSYRANGTGNIYDLDIEFIDGYLSSRVNLKTSSINLVKQAIKHFLYYCQFHKGIELGIDFQLIRRQREIPPKIRTFTTKEIKNVLRQVDNSQDKLMIAVLFETGIRIGELVKLNIQDIRGTEIRVRGKGARDRTVYITASLSAALKLHASSKRISYGPLFRHQMQFSHLHTDSYTTCTARGRIQSQFEKTGIKMHPHELRHSFAIEWLTKNGDLRTLQKLLGHSSLEITERYLQTTDSYTQQSYERIFTESVI